MNKISKLNTFSYNLSFDINKLQTSIKNNFAFDQAKVEKIFLESKIYFADSLKKDYEELISFNEELTKDRNRLLKKTLKSKNEELEKINLELQELNNKKENLLSFLKDTNTFRKLKEYQKDLARLESDLIQLQERLKIIDMIIHKDDSKEVLKNEIEGTIKLIRNFSNNTERNEKYKQIRDLFSKFFLAIMNEDTYIMVYQC